MTPRFLAILSALFLAAVAYLRPARLAELFARWYAMVTHKAPPMSINTLVHYLPLILIACIILVTAADAAQFVREKRERQKIRRKYERNPVLADAKKDLELHSTSSASKGSNSEFI